MDKIRKNKRINALVLCLGELIIGILLLVKPFLPNLPTVRGISVNIRSS